MAARDLVIGGVHACRVAFERGPELILEVWVRRSADADDIQAAAAALGVPVHRADDATLTRLNGDPHHQGVVVRRRPPAFARLEDVLARVTAPPLFLVLDQVTDPRNFGACLRAADGAGVDAVVFARDRAAPVSSVVAKAASGAVDTVTLVAVTNLARALAALRGAGVWSVGAAHDGAIDYCEFDLTLASALVLGAEGEGLRRLTRERCDALVRIPMFGQVPSLNVASAAAVMLFEARRQRRGVAPQTAADV
jgi:23S rRNA (guanosine2251-2'-O)-methyltransferase